MKKSFMSLLIACTFSILVSEMAQGQPLIVENPTPKVVEHSNETFSGLVFIPSSHDFGGVGLSNHKTYNFQLRYDGYGQASGSVFLSGDPEFSCVSGCSYNLSHSQSQYVTIEFTPCDLEDFDTTIYAGSVQATAIGEGVPLDSCD